MKEKVIEQFGNRFITLNLYSIKFDSEKDYLVYKRDVNLPQDLVGKKLSYMKTKNGLIYNSKQLKQKK